MVTHHAWQKKKQHFFPGHAGKTLPEGSWLSPHFGSDLHFALDLHFAEDLASPSTAKDRVITALSAQPHKFFRKGARKLTKFMKIMNVGSVIPVFWSFWTWTTTTCTHGAAEFQLISILWLNFGYIYWNTFKLLDVHVRLEYLDQVGMLVFQRIVGPTWIHQAPAVEVSCKHVPLTRPPYQRP